MGYGSCVEDELIYLFGGAESKHALGDAAAYDVGGSWEDGAWIHGGSSGEEGPDLQGNGFETYVGRVGGAMP